MSEKDVEDLQDKARGNYHRAQETLNAAKQRAEHLALEMEALAGHLRNQPWNIAVDSYPWLMPDTVRAIKEDIAKADAEAGQARQKAQDLGVVV